MLKLLRMALFASFTALGTFVAVPLPYLIMGHSHLPNAEEWAAWHALSLGLYTTSAQTLALGVAGTLLNPVMAFASQALYLLIGLAGLPIFADGGGPGYLHSPHFPFLLMFPFAAWLSAKIARSGGFRRRWWGLMAAQVLVIAVGAGAEFAGDLGYGLQEAWKLTAWPMMQTLPSLMLAMIPLAVLGAVGDRWRRVMRPVPQPVAAPERDSLPERTGSQPLPVGRQIAGPPDRLKLGEAPRKPKAIEGPPPRISLPDGPQDS